MVVKFMAVFLVFGFKLEERQRRDDNDPNTNINIVRVDPPFSHYDPIWEPCVDELR